MTRADKSLESVAEFVTKKMLGVSVFNAFTFIARLTFSGPNNYIAAKAK